MNFKYIEAGANSDDTFNYRISGDFPIKFSDFFAWVLDNDTSFRIEFAATNDCYGGWLGNRIEIEKSSGVWHWERNEPKDWFNKIRQKNVVKCWANGGWGQMIYFCTFDVCDK